jgi:hypothetical protein
LANLTGRAVALMSNLMPMNEVMGSMNVYNADVAVTNCCSVPGNDFSIALPSWLP